MAKHQEGFLQAKDGLRLFWQSDLPQNPKARVALVHGYAEHIGRYQPVIDALVADRIAVFGFDCRGHGRSEGRRGYCNRFSDYLDDLEVFVQHLPANDGPSVPRFILGHSHGGLIAIHHLARGGGEWAGLVLSSPYLRLALTPPKAKVFAARLVEKVLPWAPFKNEIAFDQLTRDARAQELVSRDPLYNRTVTPRWFSESTRAQAEALSLGPKLTLPVLVICGAEDPIASTATTRGFFATLAAREKNYQEYPGMLHETLNEIGKEEVWKQISRWISGRLPGKIS
jgi:alpha-beta hydrolase superfamily lysophospholipase